MTAQLAENNTLLKKISYDTARPSQDEPNFSIMPKEKVAQIRKLRGDDMTKFALDLESELFAGNPEEQKMVLEKRIEGADKVQFIKHCVFMFYEIHHSARKTTWRNIRNALNSRARKKRTDSALRSANRLSNTPEISENDSN
ncbi:hypothetical protein Q1695_002646 [Nippostrongylus brasiliensis]|nr:hypothetical protein Q1695_002646 [Nippostrongylus brasiliensis]